MSNLPNEILLIILSIALEETGFKNLMKLRRTCKQWYSIIPIVIKEGFGDYQEGWIIKLLIFARTLIAKPLNIQVGLPKFNEQQMMFNLENINLPSMNTPQVVDCLFTLYYDWNYVTGLKLFGYSKMNMGQSNHKGINNTLILDKENLKTVKIVNWEVKAEDVFLALDKSRE